MTTSTDSLDKGGGAPEPGTELTDRLVRRRTDPVGIIDVRRPARHYERTAGWVARRFSMLDHLKNRYGVDESASSGESMVFTSSQRQSLTAPDRAPSSPPRIARSLAQAVASKTSVAPAAPSMPVEEFRVRRRASDGAFDRGTAQGAVRRKEMPGAREFAVLSDGERSDSPPAAPTTEPSRFESPVMAGFSTQAGPSGAAGSIEAAPGESASRPVPSDVSRAAESASPLPLRVRRKRSETGVEADSFERALRSDQKPTVTANLGGERTGADGASGSPAGPAHATVAAESALPLPLRAQRKQERGASGQGSPGGAAASGALAIAPVSREASRETSTGEVVNRMPEATVASGGRAARAEVESRAALPLVQRRVSDGLRGAEARATGDSSGPRTPAAPVIRNASAAAPSPAMVWRQSAAPELRPELREAAPDTNKRPQAGELFVARQSSTGGSASSNMSQSAQPAPATALAGGIDLGQIAEHVGRLLSRQLAVERERRGRGR